MRTPHLVLGEVGLLPGLGRLLPLNDDHASVLGLGGRGEGEAVHGGRPGLDGLAHEGRVRAQAVGDPRAVGQEGHGGDLYQAADVNLEFAISKFCSCF